MMTTDELTAPAIPQVFDSTPQQVYWQWHRKGRIIENKDGSKSFGYIPLKQNPQWPAVLLEYWLVYPYINKRQVKKMLSRNQIRHHGVWKRFTDILQTGSLSKLTVNDEKELKQAISALGYGLFHGGDLKTTLLPQIKDKNNRKLWIWNYVTACIQPDNQTEREKLWGMISRL